MIIRKQAQIRRVKTWPPVRDAQLDPGTPESFRHPLRMTDVQHVLCQERLAQRHARVELRSGVGPTGCIANEAVLHCW
jgi:hypothetical protein